jgi:hypothetical protein
MTISFVLFMHLYTMMKFVFSNIRLYNCYISHISAYYELYYNIKVIVELTELLKQ